MKSPSRTLALWLAGYACAGSGGCGAGLHSRGPKIDATDGSPPSFDAVAWPDRPGIDLGSQCLPTSQVPDPGVSKVVDINGATLVNCEAVLVIDKFVFSAETKSTVTLRRVSSEGILPGQPTKALGPVFSVTTEVQFPQPVRVGMTFTPFYPIPTRRWRLASYPIMSRLWISFTNQNYDAASGMLGGILDNTDWNTIEFAPLASCDSNSDCIAPLPTTCRGGVGVCQ